MTVNSQKIFFSHLDVVRLVAALSVTLGHAYESYWGWFFSEQARKEFIEKNILCEWFDNLMKSLGIGVDVFFLISGFLITYILLVEKQKFGKIDIWKFIVRRSLRIWPLYFLLIILAPVFIYLTPVPKYEGVNYLATALFVNNFHGIYHQTWIYPFSHFWSLCIEEQFYIIWPFLLAFISIKRFLKIVFILVLISICYRYYCFVKFPDDPNEIFWHTYLNTLSRMDVLVFGALGAYYYFKKPFEFSINRIYGIAAIILLIFLVGTEVYTDLSTWYSVVFRKYIFLALYAFILINYNFNKRIVRILPEKSIIHYFGKVSYGIYMYGNIILPIVIAQIMYRFKSNDWFLFFPVVLFLSLVIPWLSYEYFEKYFLKFTKRFKQVETDR